MPRTFLKDVQPGDYLEDVFVLTQKQLSTTQTGKPFIKCFIGDATKAVPARMWNATQSFFNALPDGGFLRVAGRVENYQDNIQFIIDRFWIIDDEREIVLEHLLPHTQKSIPDMFTRITELVTSVKNRELRAIVDAYLNDETLMTNFRRAPAAMTFHHAYIGGLLEHTLSLCELADTISRFYSLLNRDLLVVGAFIHDLGKTWELTYAAGFGYSDGGHLVGHISKGAVWVEEKSKVASELLGAPISPALVNVLQHLVLSHHGTYEHGAARLPSTPEAIALHLIDNIDAKLTMSLSATRGSEQAEGNFTEFVKALGGKLYRPDVAPADASNPA